MRCTIALVALAGCASYQSSYHRSHSAPSELVWRYHDHFQVTREGKIVAEQRDWDSLSGVVACVPRAREWADSAASGDRTGSVLSWTGLAVLAGGVVAGSVLLFSDLNNTDQSLLGAGIMLGGAVTGGTLAVTGLITRARADAHAIDAVNLYNDERASCAP
jgi:hypothetical protein